MFCLSSCALFAQTEFSVNPGDFVPPTVIPGSTRTTYDVSAMPGDVWHFEVLESSLAYHSVCAQVADNSNNVLLSFTSSVNCGSGGLSKSFTATKQGVYRISIGPVGSTDMIAHLSFGCAGVCPAGPTDVTRATTVTPRDLTVAKPGGGTVSVSEAFHLYRFYSTAGTQITLDLRRTGSSGNPCWRLYTPGGVFVQESCSSLEAKASFLTTQTGYYLAYIIRTGISADMLYTLTVGCSPNCPAPPPPVTTPTLQAAPTSLSFTSAQPQTLNITGSTALNFTAKTSGESWLSLNPSSGTTPGSVSVTASPTGLSAGTYSSTITLSATGAAEVTVPVKLTVAPPTTTRVTITSLPAGLAVLVDGAAITTPHDFDWTPASSHTLDVTSPQTAGSTRYTYDHWSQGGAKSQTIAAPSTATSYTATFIAQYLLTTNVTPSNGGTLKASPASTDGFYGDGAQVQLTATAAEGFTFTGFTGDLSATSSPQTLTVNGSKTVAANFTANRPLTSNPSQLMLSAAQGSNATGTLMVDGPAGQSVTVTADQAWLRVSPAQGTPSFSVNVTAASGSLATGTYQGNVILGGTLNVPVSFTLNPAPVAPRLVTNTLAAGLQFQLFNGSAAPPPQTIAITSSDGSALTFNSNVTYPAGSSNWANLSTRSGQTPGSLDVSVQVTALNKTGTYTATLVLTSPGSTVVVSIPLTLNYAQPPPSKIQVDVQQLTISTAGDVQRRPIIVTNAGPSVLQFTAGVQTADGGKWLSVTPGGAGTTDSQPAVLQVTTDPTGLSPGVYSGTISINAANQDPLTVTVVFAVGAAKMLITADKSLNFVISGNYMAFPPQSMELLASGTSAVNWQAQANVSWISITPSSGVARPGVVATTSFTIDVSQLTVGSINNGAITVNSDSSGGALTVPVMVQVVPLNVSTVRVVPTGMAFVAPTLPDKTAIFLSSKAGPINVTPNQPWLRAKEVSQPGLLPMGHAINISIVPGEWPAGQAENRGAVTIQDLNGATTIITVLLFVPATVSGTSAQTAAVTCVPSKFLPLFTSLLPSFEQASGAATSTEIIMIDDCGNPVTSGVTGGVISNRDPQLNLNPLGDGRWKATWGAGTATSFAGLSVIGADPERGINPSAPAQALSSIVGMPVVPVLDPLQPFASPAGVALPAIAPNMQFLINGQNLTNSDLSPPTVLLGGTPLAVISSLNNQLLVLTPPDLPVNVEMQLVVQRGDGSSNIPAALISAQMWPSMAAPPDGKVIWVTGLGNTPEQLKVEGVSIRKLEARGKGLWRVELDRPVAEHVKLGRDLGSVVK